MLKRSSGPRGWLLASVIAGVLSAGGWIWWSATQKADIGFLPQRAGGHWIVYPTEFDQNVGRPVELSTVFQKSFTLEQAPARAILSLATFRTGRVSINGVEISPVTEPRKNWKSPEVLDVSRYLRTGTNHLTITVLNSNGPPALWLSLKADAVPVIASGEDWQCTYAGAVLRSARLATRPKVVSQGNAVSSGPEPWASLCARRLTLLCFVVLASGAAWSLSWLSRRNGLAFTQPERGSLPEAGIGGHEAGKLAAAAASPTRNRWWIEVLPLALVAVLWVALFANNASVIPGSVGFDADGHLDYIRHVQEHRRLPLANEGWEMFQPPMYYALSAGLLGMLSLSAGEPDGALALRWFGLVIGLIHVGLVWASMRLLFPAPSGGGKFSANLSVQWFGVLLAGCLPPLIYISHYITNEGLGAMLVSGSVYLTLRCVREENPSWKLMVGLGLCLGAALLAKSTALVAVPVVVGAMIWRGLKVAEASPGENPESKAGILNSSWKFGITPLLSLWVWRACLVLVLCSLVCGWHYARVWSRFGKPIVGNWEAASGFGWWQDPGFQTSAGYVRFGSVLRDPWGAGNASFGDGLYSTLWGDGLFGGTLVPTYRPPWNYELMAAGYWLALVPTLLLVIGGLLAGARWIRRLSVEWSLLLGLGFLITTAIIQISLVQPAYSTAKAFYGLSALIPFCACAAAGWELLTRRSGIWGRWMARSLCVMFGVWALNSYASFWVIRHSGPVSVLRAWSLLDHGQQPEAAAALQACLRSDPTNADARCLLATMLLDAGAPDKTIQQASLVLVQQPDHAMAHHLLGGGLARMQQIGDGLAHARRAMELAPGWGAPYEKLTALLLWQHRNDEAVEIGRTGLAVVPFSPELRQTLGTALLASGKPAEAEAQFTVFAGLTPDQAQAHCQAAMAFQSANEISFAVTHYQKAIQINPNLPEALGNLAWIRAANAQAEFRNGTEAVELAERASRLTGGQDMAALATLAVAYAEAGRFAEATEAATRARDRALAGNRKDLAETNQRLVELFTARQPFHEPLRR